MCPLCITTLALAAAGASASGGLAAFVVRKPRPKTGSKSTNLKKAKIHDDRSPGIEGGKAGTLRIH